MLPSIAALLDIAPSLIAFALPFFLVAIQQPELYLHYTWPLDYDLFFPWKIAELRAEGTLPEVQSTCFTAPRPREELYDLARDPGAYQNLSADADHSPVLGTMRHRLLMHQLRAERPLPRHWTY